jgi:chemotaxis protein methyltransferase CheR
MAFTYFFRDLQTMETIRDYALPIMKTRQRIRVWDAGCATGMEPYTLAIVLRENMGSMYFRNVKIFASDIDESNLFGKIIEDGVYSKDHVERILPEIVKTYFHEKPDGKSVEISEELRKAVSYRRHDLLTLKPIENQLNLIICKNVLLHFNYEQRLDVIWMFYNALDEGGFIAFEQTQKMPDEMKPFFKQVAKNAQVFQKII